MVSKRIDERMSKQMDKQVDKQTNNKRLALKKGQVDILEVLYGCRFGGCWLFWVGLKYPRIYLLDKTPFPWYNENHE